MYIHMLCSGGEKGGGGHVTGEGAHHPQLQTSRPSWESAMVYSAPQATLLTARSAMEATLVGVHRSSAFPRPDEVQRIVC